MYEMDTLSALRLLTPGVEDVEGAAMEVEVEVSSTLSKWRLGHPAEMAVMAQVVKFAVDIHQHNIYVAS